MHKQDTQTRFLTASIEISSASEIPVQCRNVRVTSSSAIPLRSRREHTEAQGFQQKEIYSEGHMSTNFHLASMIGSIAFIVLVGCGFIVVLTVPALAQKPIYPMLAVVGVALLITPVIGWYVATRIQQLR